jgi:glucose/arabinose dehydrogenase/PKD repeat protein
VSAAAILSGLLVSPVAPGLGQVAAAAPARANGVVETTAGLPSQFVDETIATGLNLPTALAFAPDGRVFVTEKRGMVKTWPTLAAFDSNAVPDLTLDLRSDVMNYWDRGLLGLTVDPGWPAKPYIYLNYTYNALPGGSAPAWPSSDADNDPCLNPPGSTTDGCVVTSRVERVTVDTGTGAASARKVLLTGWCQQFPSHSAGSVQFGADGMLYVSGGEGGSFNVGSQDYGEYGGTLPNTTRPITPKNPCGDPPAGVGGTMTAPTAEGGALRAQSFRRASTEPAVYNGAVLRIDPATGAAAPDNATAGDSDPARQRIVAYGLRNPFRIAFRPGTNDLYIGDVGYETWEEVDRLPNPKAAPTNFGWPCHEGPAKDTYFTSVQPNLCTSLADSAVTNPLYDYQQASHMASGDGCPPTSNPSASASVSGLAFAIGADYPAPYDGALFVADYARNCIVVLPDRGDGIPSSTAIPFESSAGAPVMLTQDPDGNIAYVDFTDGTIHRIRYGAPIARFTATPTSGADPLLVQFNGSTSSAPAGIASYDWDFGDGSAHGSGATTSHTYAIGTWTARLTVTDTNGLTASKTQTIASGNLPPAVTLVAPTCTTSCWVVGDTIAMSATATDPEDGTLPPSAFSWHVGLEHCHTPTDCHEHDLLDPVGVRSTSIVAPDHEDGAYLRITVTVTDSGGLTDSASIDVHPKLSTLKVVSSPAGLPVTLDGTTANGSVGPVNEIVGHAATISAPARVVSGETVYTFKSWSDGGALSHVVTVPVSAKTVTATFAKTAGDASNTCAGAPISETGAWTSGAFGSPNDIDWIRFSVPTAGWYRVLLGSLPVNGVLSLYAGCSTLLQTSNAGGTHWEEVITHLNAGTHALKLSSVGGASSASSYQWLVKPMSGTVPLLAASYAPSSAIRLVGDVFNTSSTPRSVTVTAKLYSSSGKLLKTVAVHPLVPVLGGHGRSSFVVSTTRPTGFAYVRWTVSSTAASRATRTLATTGVSGTDSGGGVWTIAGSVKNTSTTTASSVLALVTIHDALGTPINATTVAPASRTIAAGASSPFSARFGGLSIAPNGWIARARAV